MHYLPGPASVTGGRPAARPAIAYLPPLSERQAADLTPAQRRLMVIGIVALHVAGAWGLMQIDAVRQVVTQAAPMFIDVIAPANPPVPTPPPPVAPAKTLPPPVTTPVTPPMIAAPASPAPAAFTTPAEPAPPDPAPVIVAAPAPLAPAVAPAPAPAPAPKVIPPSAVQFVEPPVVVYPRLSRRNGEAGQVIVRAYIDTTGVPRQVQVDKSSGHARLDEAAIAAVQKSRLKPHTENGQPVEGWARIPINFELER